MKSHTKSVNEYLAIKTLKGVCIGIPSLTCNKLFNLLGFFDHTMVRDMLKECSRMSTLNHLHVLTLKGVCLDGGPAPYIIMPFMANGSLLAYLKKNRKSLVISHGNVDNEDVCYRLVKVCAE